jgi:hypothetical protein
MRMISIARLFPLRAGCLLALAFAMSAAQADEAAMTKRATELRESPGESSRSLAALPAQAPVTRLTQRQGPWIQVKSAEGATGWVHLFDIGPASGGASTSAPAGASANPLRGVTNLLNRGSTPTTATSASGIRGLGAEDLARAQPNPAAVGQLEALRQSEQDARNFAARAPWSPVAVEPLPAPSRPASRGGDAADPSRQ